MESPPDAVAFDDDLEPRLRRRLLDMNRRGLPAEGLRRAAVAVVVVPNETGAASLVLTRRADHLGRHSGQYALPGGRLDAGESVVEGALRELHEEVGLDLGESSVLGRLDDFVTRSGYHMATVAVWGGRDAVMKPDPGEVAAIHRVPVTTLADPGRRHITESEFEHPLLALEIVGTWVFAPTAAILLQMAELAVHGRVLRVAHYEQPKFAWT